MLQMWRDLVGHKGHANAALLKDLVKRASNGRPAGVSRVNAFERPEQPE
jgi:hypothetical protein